MKAVIMAGGEGSRLRPLTCGRPKPMMPVLNRPIMSYILELLKQHNFQQVGVTLQYMPDDIKNYYGNGAEFGLNMRYFIEETPLGTAGSVKNCGSFLDSTFLVISGDALTDFDLTAALNFHRQKGAMATLVLTRVPVPLEYGVVITDKENNIKQFLEKPAWGEVFSDTVNTGIYILEPEAMDYVEQGKKFDFSKDLFPLLLKNKKTVCGVVLEGYWCDIGNLQQYLQAQVDCLDGRVKIQMPGEERLPGVWAGKGTEILTNRIQGPVVIGERCTVAAGVRLEPYTVLGDGCVVQQNASIKRSVVWNGVYLGSGTALRGAVLCSRVLVQSGVCIYEGAVVGSDSVIKARAVIKPDIKIWPQKVVEESSVVQHSLVWGTRSPKKIFGLCGVTGTANVDITPEFALKLSAAFASTLGPGPVLAISSDACPSSLMIKSAVISGLQSAGAQVQDAGEGITPMLRFALREGNLNGGVHIKLSSRRQDQNNIIFMNSAGGNISRTAERKVENALIKEDFKRAEPTRISSAKPLEGTREVYVQWLARKLGDIKLDNIKHKIIMFYHRPALGGFIDRLSELTGLQITNINNDIGPLPRDWQSCLQSLPLLSDAVVRNNAWLGAMVDASGETMVVVDEKGRVIGEEMLTALVALMVLKSKLGPVVVPVTAPSIIDAMAKQYGGRIVRSKTAVQDLLEKVLAQEEQQGAVSQYLMNFDALGALVNTLSFTIGKEISLSQLVQEIPEFFVNRKDVAVPWEYKGTVIRRIIEEPLMPEMELFDGVKVFHPQGWALVLPDPEEPLCRVFSEGVNMEMAESLADIYVERIKKIVGA